MKKNKQGFASLVLLVIIALVAIGGGVYYFSQKSSINGTSDWKLHTDAARGIAFSYPEDWSVISVADWSNLQEAEAASYRTPGHIVFTKVVIGKYTSYEAFKDKTAYQVVNVISEKELTIDGNKAIAVLFTPKEGSKLEYYRYHIFKGGDKYSFDIAADNKVSEADMKTFDQVMTTVKLSQ